MALSHQEVGQRLVEMGKIWHYQVYSSERFSFVRPSLYTVRKKIYIFIPKSLKMLTFYKFFVKSHRLGIKQLITCIFYPKLSINFFLQFTFCLGRPVVTACWTMVHFYIHFRSFNNSATKQEIAKRFQIYCPCMPDIISADLRPILTKNFFS